MLRNLLRYFGFAGASPEAALRDEIAARLSSPQAIRSRSVEWGWGFWQLLPDPDDILRKLGKGLEVYRALTFDAHVWSCYQSRKSGTTSCEWEIREGTGTGVRANRQAVSLIEKVMSDLDVYQAINDILDAPFFGLSPIEVIWEVAQNKAWLPDSLVGRPPEWFAFGPDNDFRFLSKDHQWEGEPIPDKKFLLARHHANYRNPYGERLLSRCFWPVTFKKGGLKYWAIFAEKFGMPWVVGKVPPGTNDTERNAILSKLTQMVQDAVAVINDDESIEFPEPSGRQASNNLYGELIAVANREISKAILGQTLTTELDKGGSYAATKEHMEVRQDLIDQDKRLVADCFNQLFAWIGELNGLSGAIPEFAFFEEEDIQQDRAQRDKLLSDQGVKLTRNYYLRTYNLEEDDIAPEEVTPAVPVAGQAVGTIASGVTPSSQAPVIPQFAEFIQPVGATHASPDHGNPWPDLDRLLDQAMAASGSAIEEIIAPVKDLLAKADSLEQVRDKLYTLYPETISPRLAEIVGGLSFAAELTGYLNATEERATHASPLRNFSVSTLSLGFNTPFDLALEYARRKGYALSPDSWRDVWQDVHTHAFTVARVTSMDVLQDIRGYVDEALKAGTTLRQFQKDLIPRLQQAGWWAAPGEAATILMPDGSERKRLTAARLGTIYETNLSVANSVGRWKQIEANKTFRPYVLYTGVDDLVTRPTHAALHGRVFLVDDPYLAIIAPQNGYMCRCFLRSLSERDLARRGLKISKAEDYQDAPDEGWDYNPGAAAMSSWQPDLSKYAPALAAQFKAVDRRIEQERMLRESPVQKHQPIVEGVHVSEAHLVTFPDGLRAIFKPNAGAAAHQNAAEAEEAFYKIDKLLGSNLVPPTVTRELNIGLGGKGSLQLWDEEGKQAKKSEIKGLDSDLQKMRLLDWIFDNVDRHEGNWLVRPDRSVVAIDNEFSFLGCGRRLRDYLPPKISDWTQEAKNLAESILRNRDKIKETLIYHGKSVSLEGVDYRIEELEYWLRES